MRPDDLSQLEVLDENTIVHALRGRFQKDENYVSVPKMNFLYYSKGVQRLMVLVVNFYRFIFLNQYFLLSRRCMNCDLGHDSRRHSYFRKISRCS